MLERKEPKTEAPVRGKETADLLNKQEEAFPKLRKESTMFIQKR